MSSCVDKELTLTNIDRMKTPYLDTEIELLEGFKDRKEASFYQLRKLAEYREIKQLLIHSVVKSLPMDYEIELEKLNQLRQTQASTNTQLVILRAFAHKLGLYDASDYIKIV